MAVCPDGHQSTATDFCDTCGMRIEGAPSGSAAATGGLSADVRSAAGAAGAAGVAGAAGPGSAAGAGGAAEQCPQCGTERSGQFCEVCGYDYATGAAARPVAPVSFGSVPAAPAMPAVATPTLAAATPATPAPATIGPATPDPASAATPPGPGLAPPGPGTGSALPAPATFHADPTQTGLAGAALAWSAVITADRAYYDSVIAAGGPDAASIQFPSYCPERRFQLTGREMRIGRRSASRGLEPEIDLTGPPADPGVSHLHAVLIAQANGTWSVLDPGSSNGTQVNGNDIEAGVPVPLHDGDHILLGAWTRLTIQAS